jgi:hypothetical protein
MASHEIGCVICGKPLPIEEAKTEDDGLPVHEECYVLRLKLKRAAGEEDTDPGSAGLIR